MADEEYVDISSECNMEFFNQFVLEAYDVINIGPYVMLLMCYQFLGFVGMLFSDAISLAEIIKFTYKGYQHMYSAEGLKMY